MELVDKLKTANQIIKNRISLMDSFKGLLEEDPWVKQSLHSLMISFSIMEVVVEGAKRMIVAGESKESDFTQLFFMANLAADQILRK